MTYPDVVGELATLQLVTEGHSLARYGDGEFNLCRGGHSKQQRHDPELARRLREILQDAGDCLVGIPNLHSRTPKAAFWAKYADVGDLLNPAVSYVSAFVTRPDSAPWIDVPTYWERLESLWVGQRVTLVRGNARSLVAADLIGAEVQEVIAARDEAWRDYDELLALTLETHPTRVLICLGPTATVLAVDLAAQGMHAIDLGHAGMFLKKHRAGLPMTVTAKDKAT